MRCFCGLQSGGLRYRDLSKSRYEIAAATTARSASLATNCSRTRSFAWVTPIRSNVDTLIAPAATAAATDGMSRNGLCNGLYAMDTFGPGRALSRHFFRGPLGGEVAGPCFTPDGRTLFLSIQHPGQSDTFGKKVGVFASPTTRFPDYKETMPARSGVIVIVKADGGKIGT